MEKIKSILSPGHSKDDEVMYGTVTDKPAPSSASPSEQPTKLETSQGVVDHGVARQVLNPGGDKYDELRYGTTASEAPRDQMPQQTTVGDQTAQGTSDHGVARQILNPGGDKYDELRYGTTSSEVPRDQVPQQTSVGDQTSQGVAGQSSLATGEKYNDISYEPPEIQGNSTTGAGAIGEGASGAVRDTSGTVPAVVGAVPGTIDSAPKEDTESCLSVKSGRFGPFAGGADARATETVPTSTTSAPPYEGIVGGADARATETAPTGTTSASSYEGIVPGQSLADRVAERERMAQSEAAERDRLATAAAAGGVGAGVLGAGAYAASRDAPQDPSTTGESSTTRLPSSNRDADVDNATYTYSSYKVGSDAPAVSQPDTASGSASRPPLATALSTPHIPGEFPTETGEDPHDVGQPQSTAGTYSTGSSAGPATTSTQTSAAQPPSDAHSSGYDAAIGTVAAGALGAGGIGAYEAYKHRDAPAPVSSSQDGPTYVSQAAHTQQPTPAPTAATEVSKESTPAATAPTTTAPETSDHHYGRDAAIAAGGAGVVGAGTYAAYEATKSDGQSVPTSTGGPLASQAAHSAQPAPAPVSAPQASAAGTSGPTTNISATTAPTTGAPEPTEHHFGRDAAVVGGAGALGAGAYEATKGEDRYTPTAGEAPLSSQAAHSSQPAPAPTTGTTAPETAAPTATEHHYGRDAAVAGGVGAVGGVGAYEAAKHYEAPTSADPTTAPASQYPTTSPTAAPTAATQQTPATVTQQQPTTIAQEPGAAGQPTSQPEETHYGRDAAIAGGGAAAVGAAGYAAYDATQGQDPQALKEQEKAAKEQAKQQEKMQKEQAKQQEKAQKEQAKEQEKAQKEQAKEQEKAQKEQAKEQKKAEKEHEKEQKKAEKEHEKEQKKAEKEQAKEQKKIEKEQAKEEKAQSNKLQKRSTETAAAEDPEEAAKYGEDNDRSTAAEAAGAAGVVGAAGAAGYAGTHAAEAHDGERAGEPEYDQHGSAVDSDPSNLSSHHNNKVITDATGHSKLHKKKVELPTQRMSSEASDGGRPESTGAVSGSGSGHEKHGLLSKILHPSRSKREKEEWQEDEARRSVESSGANQPYTGAANQQYTE